ncbi:MAG: hypothetical protein LBR28_01460 [Bacteroidales bacterium]|jgi:hypothetical protein|nr:hypothetical protein [Bacteroidales bacterium]
MTRLLGIIVLFGSFISSSNVIFAQRENIDNNDSIIVYSVNDNFLSKGRSMISFSVGFEEKKMNDDYLLTILKIDEIKSQRYDLSFGGSYFINDNVAIGGRILYSFYDQTYHLDAKMLELLIDAENFSTSTVKSSYALGAGVRHFVPMGTGRKFFIFNETNFIYSYTTTLTRDVYNNLRIEKNFWVDNSIAIKLSPGIMYFLTKGFAFEFSLSPISLYYKWGTILHNEEIKGSSHDASLNFSLFPFNIYFGLSYYFNKQ